MCSMLCTVIILQISRHHGMVVAVRNNTTIKEFSELQDRCFAMNLTLIPIVNVSELPQLLVHMVCNIFILYFRYFVMEMNMQIYHSLFPCLFWKSKQLMNVQPRSILWGKLKLVKPGCSVLYGDFITEVCIECGFLCRHMWNPSHQEIHSNNGRNLVMS